MSSHIEQLIRQSNRGKFLLFWGHQPAKDGTIRSTCLSQWWVAPFSHAGKEYRTAEHWMMAQKALLFGDAEIHARILAARTPGEAKKLGRAVRGFDPVVWDAQKFEIVVEGNVLKFSQNPAEKEFLLQTGERVLVEASPVDRVWGIGLAADHPDALYPEKWKGHNLLGFALMEVRKQLKNE
jgi:hypothetical protein